MTTERSATVRFRETLRDDDLAFLLEAHDGVSARIVGEAGFDGIWASSFALSASRGVRDNNELSFTQVLAAVEFMSDVTATPILVDADTGYGSFNHFRRFVRKLERRGAAAVCVEDKTFPKTNSFVDDERKHRLARVEDVTAKVAAAKDVVQDQFSVVARTEAFIANRGLEEALDRATAYHEAGADAVLVHSKASTAEEVLRFASAWEQRCPVVVVPTTYYDTPVAQFREAGISAVIWANHMVRAAIQHMQRVAERVAAERSVEGVEVDGEIVPIEEVFRLQDLQELDDAAERYHS